MALDRKIPDEQVKMLLNRSYDATATKVKKRS
mgnify:CR=1 FL=1